MKRVQIIFLSVLAVMVSSCDDFLTQDPQNSLSIEQIFADLNNIQPYLNNIYYDFRAAHSDRAGFYTRMGTDEIRIGDCQCQIANEGALNYYNGLYNTENTCIASMWKSRWPVVVQSAQAIDALAGRTGADDKEQQNINLYIAQAKFYRGAMLFELAQYWGALPLTQVENGAIILSARKTIQETYQQIVTDLEEAAADLPVKRQEDGRIPTAWAAKAMLARVYMSAPQESGYQSWQKASDALQEIIDSGVYKLMPNYSDLWDPAVSCTDEAIFTLYFNNVWPDLAVMQWYTGSRAVSGKTTCPFGGYELVLPTEWAYSKTTQGGVWEEGDLRYDETIRTDFTYKGEKAVAVAGFGDDQLDPHIKKYEDNRIEDVYSIWYAGKNIYYLRYADVLLLQAECKARLGKKDEAVALVNQVRKRGFGENWTDAQAWTSYSIETLMDERTREFCCEEWRRIDLKRSGLFIARVKKYNKWAKENNTLDEHHLLYPFPQTETKINPNLSGVQNPGY